jgi:hypothetical protein
MACKHAHGLGCGDIRVMAVCKRQLSALPLLTYKTYAALRFSKAVVFDSP